jgi:protein-S-isoprenylcysteine O-methyltransferase Ste14
MNPRGNDPKARSMQWQRIARRIRVPMGFVMAALYLVECARHEPHYAAIAWSLVLVVPGLALRAVASGTVKKNRELTVTGPYAYTRNPLYLGSALMAAGFGVALGDWAVGLVIAVGFAVIYVPVIAAEERFLRATFAGFDDYCRQTPRFLPRFTKANLNKNNDLKLPGDPVTSDAPGGFSLGLYLSHREYNSALGAALLYLSLLFLHPVLEHFLPAMR